MTKDDDTTHECPSPGCIQRVPSDRFACPTHWYKLPKELRDQMWREFRREMWSEAHIAAMTRGKQFLEELAAH